VLYRSIGGLRTRVVDRVNERDLMQVGENSKFPVVLGCKAKAETVAMCDEKKARSACRWRGDENVETGQPVMS
jgi:hypothetical protein